LYDAATVRISVSKAREKLSEVVEMSQSEPVELEHYRRRAAVLVSPSQYDAMLEAFEESQDVASYDATLGEVGENNPWELVKADLGWS
jgi:antitoxin Phd